MAATNEDIANSALSKLGGELITSLSDTSRRAVLANRQFAKIRAKLLRSHPWNFAIKRQFLTKVQDFSDSVAFATDTFTSKGAATLNHVTGERTRITLNSGTLPQPLQENTIYYFINLTATTFQLASTQENALNGVPIDIADSPVFDADFDVIPPFEFDNKYEIPSDMLRAIREQSKKTDWRVEGDFIIANLQEFNLVYIANITDPTKFDESFDELFAAMLAVELSYNLVQSNSLKQELKDDLNRILRDTRSFDAQEGQPEALETDEWLISRQ